MLDEDNIMKKLLLILFLISAGCDFIPEKVAMSDARLQPMLEAAASFDRAPP